MENRELSVAQTLAGLEFERLIALAGERMKALAEARLVYESHLRQVHECGDDWKLNDWAQGFVRPVEEQADESESIGIEEAGNDN